MTHRRITKLPVSVEIETDAGTLAVEATFYPGRPSFDYYEPDDPPELEVWRVTRDGVEVDYEDLPEYDRQLVDEAVGERVAERECWPW